MYKKIRKNAADGKEGAIRTAVSLLAYKDNTEKELFGKLTDRGYDKESAAEAVRFVVEKKYLVESRHFERFVEMCVKSKGWGRRRILYEAQRKGFSESTLQEAEGVFETVDFDGCCYEMLKKSKAESAEKAYGALLRRGYSASNVRAAFRMYRDEFGTGYGSEAESGAKEENAEKDRFSENAL